MDDEKQRKEMGQRLKSARLKSGFRSKLSASQHFGWKDSSYRAHEAGDRTIGQDDAEKYARAFGVAASWIMFGDEKPPEEKSATKSTTKVPITGLAGHDRNGTIQPTEGRTVAVELPIDLTQRWEAIEVEGPLLEPFFRQNSFLLYRPVLVRDLSLLEGHECVIELLDGRRLLKRPMPDDDNPGQWLLESDLVLPMENQEIRSASPIRLIQIWNAHSRIAA